MMAVDGVFCDGQVHVAQCLQTAEAGLFDAFDFKRFP